MQKWAVWKAKNKKKEKGKREPGNLKLKEKGVGDSIKRCAKNATNFIYAYL